MLQSDLILTEECRRTSDECSLLIYFTEKIGRGGVDERGVSDGHQKAEEDGSREDGLTCSDLCDCVYVCACVWPWGEAAL